MKITYHITLFFGRSIWEKISQKKQGKNENKNKTISSETSVGRQRHLAKMSEKHQFQAKKKQKKLEK